MVRRIYSLGCVGLVSHGNNFWLKSALLSKPTVDKDVTVYAIDCSTLDLADILE